VEEDPPSRKKKKKRRRIRLPHLIESTGNWVGFGAITAEWVVICYLGTARYAGDKSR
jgi:hypothetical protein